MIALMFAIAVACGIWAGAVAAQKQRSPLGFGLLGFLFGLIGVVIAYAVSEPAFNPMTPYARR